MAGGHARLAVAGAFGHGAGTPEPKHRVRQRNVGGKLHRRGEGRKREASPIVARATVVHVEKKETVLEAKIVAGLARANDLIEAERVAEADRCLTALAAAREDITNIVRVPTPAERDARTRGTIAVYN